MRLYFNDSTTIKTTILLLVFLLLLRMSFRKRKKILHWGWCTLGFFSIGLSICILSATRDELHLTVQHAIDGSVDPGLFSLGSFQTIVGAALGIVIVISAILCLFLKKQRTRQLIFFIITGSMLLKILTIELSRIVLVIASA